MNLINCINSFSTVIVALATTVYVILTILILIENNKIRRLQINPKIVMDIITDKYSPHLLMLVVENVGNGAAFNINFNVIKEIDINDKEKIINIGFIKSGLKSLSGKAKHKTIYCNTIDYANSIEIFDNTIEIDIEYNYDSKSRKKCQLNEKIIINLSYLSDIKYLNNKPEYKIIKEMVDIN